jgi:Ribbon-helix-helix domain
MLTYSLFIRQSSRQPAWSCTLGSIAICMPVWYYVVMKRTALFLKEEQIKKLQKLSDKTGAPVAELIRRAIDRYVQERSKELK